MTFKNSKTKKTTSKKYRCVVKAEKKPVEEAYKINSATATGVKTITVELNKAVADATKITKVDVKKGTAARDSKFTVDGSKIVIKMDTKLMAGTYTVTVEGLEAAALTADVAVEKNETLTSFEISPNLTLENKGATETAICNYSALNQYGEPMVADAPSVSTSFSSVANIERVATATTKGKIKVDKIPAVLAIQGTKGTIVLVDKNNGVNTSAEVTLSAAATAAEATVVGTYNTASSAMEALRAGASLGNYYILLTVKDQYGDPVDKEAFAEVANISIAGGITNVEISASDPKSALTTVTVDGTEYIAIKLKNKIAKSGTYTMTIVNAERGLLSSATYDVVDSVVINSISINPKNGVYEKQENEMEYSIIDKDGKEVTNYAVLTADGGVRFTEDTGMKWEKNADGTAKLVYEPKVSAPTSSDTASTIATIVAMANDPTSSNYIVKTFTFTVNRERMVKSVQGLADGTSTSVAVNKELKIAFDKIVYADQYSNKVTKDDSKIYVPKEKVSTAEIPKLSTGCAVAFETVDSAFETAEFKGGNFVFKSTKPGAVNVYLKYADGSKAVKAGANNYDYKFIVTAADTGSVAPASLKIDSVNGGYAWYVGEATEGAPTPKDLSTADIKVVGMIGGAQTEIPTNQYVIKEIKNNSITQAEEAAGTKTKTATVTVQVTTWDSYNNPTETEISADFQVSVEKRKVFKVTGTDDTRLSTANVGKAVSASVLQACFKFRDQYNTDNADKAVGSILGAGKVAGNVTYSINVSEVPASATANGYRVTGNGTNGASVEFKAPGVYTVKVTAKVNDTEKTVTLKINVSASE